MCGDVVIVKDVIDEGNIWWWYVKIVFFWSSEFDGEVGGGARWGSEFLTLRSLQRCLQQ